MIFTTFWFLLFVGTFLLVFYACPTAKWRSFALAVASAMFYAHFAGTAGMVPIVALATMTYVAARTKSAIVMNLGMLLCASALIFYKYTAFLTENLARFIPLVKGYPVFQRTSDAAPLAISFFVFEFVHYLYDVKKGNPAIRSPLEFLHFSMFFPTLVAGPIKRYEQFVPALKEGLSSASLMSSDFQLGFLRVAGGFAKKLVADPLTLYINALSPGFAGQSLPLRWLIFAAIAMRIYLDFSGYSDMAIGFAKMMGIEIPENFNWPYLATSVRDFWRRWHISLSTWIRDYLYIPLGGNKVGPARHGANLLLVFFVCGLWHGAAWNFVLWGLYHGCGLVVEHAMAWPLRRLAPAVRATLFPSFPFLAPVGKAAALLSRWMLTTLFVWSGWLLFFYPPGQAYAMFVSLFHA